MAPAVSRRSAKAKPQPRALRSKPKISYAESDSDVSLDHDEEAESADEEIVMSVRRKPARPQRKQPKRSQTSSHKHRQAESDSDARKSKKRKTTKLIHVASDINAHAPQDNRVVPPWETLPYHIWVQIFQYAFQPWFAKLESDDQIQSLLKVARLHPAFLEPAYTVLYSSPPLIPMSRAHGLVETLKRDPSTVTYKYRQKVESLRLDVGRVVAYTLPGRGHLDLYNLIKDLPRLADLEFFHQKDLPPYRNLDDHIKWTYPKAIFDALEYVDPEANPERGDKTNPCRLRSWNWSSRLAGKDYPLEAIHEIHLTPSFAFLKKVAFVNYQVPIVKPEEDDPKHEALFAKAINALPRLEHLILESSTLVNAKLLPLLPTALRQLEIINCWEVVADDLAAFLLTHGRHLVSLILNHNQSLNLAFLPILGTACPRLETLYMDLKYFNLHATYRDSEPQYEHLLLPDQIPEWPSTLQTLELKQLRKWDSPAAEMFFQSLLNSAGSLAQLRSLGVEARVNVEWRERANFRKKWYAVLDRVFKRVSPPPKPMIKVVTNKPKAVSASPVKEQESPAVLPPPTRRSLRTSKESLPEDQDAEPLEEEPKLALPSKKRKLIDASNPTTPESRETRSRTRNIPKISYVESSDEEPEPESEPDAAFVSPTEDAAPKRPPQTKTRLQREVEVLRYTAEKFSIIVSPHKPGSDSGDTFDEKDVKIDENQVIQGMCDVVNIQIDNLRPMENQFEMDDFLDLGSGGEGEDSEWDGDFDEEVGETVVW